MAIAASTSCAKDENTGSTNNGSSDGSDEVIDVKYTMGYYHPTKKIKKAEPVQNGQPFYYVFSWEGDNLKSITAKSKDYNYSDISDIVYECHYSKNGYITSWTIHQEGEEDLTYKYVYKKNSISIVYATPLGEYAEYTFDNNGVLTKIGSSLVTMQNGNAVKIGTRNYIYDEHPNPFSDLLIEELNIDLPMDDMDDGCSFVSKNNGLFSNYVATGIDDVSYWGIEYDTDGWPIRWYSVINDGTSSSGVYTEYTIEYYN